MGGPNNRNPEASNINYTFGKVELADGTVPCIYFYGRQYTSFSELKEGLIKGDFGAGSKAKNIFMELKDALDCINLTEDNGRGAKRKDARDAESNDNYEERKEKAKSRRGRPFGSSVVSYLIIYNFIFYFLFLSYFFNFCFFNLI